MRGRRSCGCEGWARSEAYHGFNSATFPHRARLRTMFVTLRAPAENRRRVEVDGDQRVNMERLAWAFEDVLARRRHASR